MKHFLIIAGLSSLLYSLIKADETYLIIACISICSATVIHEIKKLTTHQLILPLITKLVKIDFVGGIFEYNLKTEKT